MKNFILILSVLVWTLFFTSCVSEKLSLSGQKKIVFTMVDSSGSSYKSYSSSDFSSTSMSDSKSSFGSDENRIANVNVYAYNSGHLFFDSYSESDRITMLLDSGREYDIYVLANVGRVKAPYEEEDLKNITCSSDLLYTGLIPMCLDNALSLNPDTCPSSMCISLTRLVSKCSLTIEKQLENCAIQVESLSIKQQASNVKPYMENSSAELTVDGDSASVLDLERLNRGEAVDFYVLENCQGVLLPDNTDPWQKTPFSVADKAGLCTYMELKGRWTTSGASADLCLRFYLGADNCKDFNVFRNTNINIKLSISDSGTLHSSWKVERANMQDNRSVDFTQSIEYVFQEDGWTLIPISMQPLDVPLKACLINESLPGSMECKVQNGKVYVRGVYDGHLEPTATLRVSSWDDAHSDEIDIQLLYRMSNFSDDVAHIPQCRAEWGYIEFADNLQYPISIITNGQIFTLEPDSSNGPLECHTHEDSITKDMYYLCPKSRKLYINRALMGDEGYLAVRYYKSLALFNLCSPYYPGIKMDDGYISEAGCTKKDNNGQYYDSYISAYLTYADGKKVPVSNFKIPDEILYHRGIDISLECGYEQFESVYGQKSFDCNTWIVAQLMPDYQHNYQRLQYYEDTGLLWGFKIAGLLRLTPGLVYQAEISFPKLGIGATSNIECRPAFPNQRFLGEYMNFSVAPGDLRCMYTDIDFTSNGSYAAPSEYLVNWEVRHSVQDLSVDLETAFNASLSSDYSKAVSVEGHKMVFSKMNKLTYPSCGHLILKGTVTNPHSNQTFEGYYSLDLSLFLSIGAKFDLTAPHTIGVSFVPFNEFSTRDYSNMWTSHLPYFLNVYSDFDQSAIPIKIPVWPSGHSIIYSDPDLPSELTDDIFRELSSYKELFEFVFFPFHNRCTELICNREGYLSFPSLEVQELSNGSKGYYYIFRQYDVDNIPSSPNNYGLDNYLIEAALGNYTFF